MLLLPTSETSMIKGVTLSLLITFILNLKYVMSNLRNEHGCVKNESIITYYEMESLMRTREYSLVFHLP